MYKVTFFLLIYKYFMVYFFVISQLFIIFAPVKFKFCFLSKLLGVSAKKMYNHIAYHPEWYGKYST